MFQPVFWILQPAESGCTLYSISTLKNRSAVHIWGQLLHARKSSKEVSAEKKEKVREFAGMEDGKMNKEKEKENSQ